MGQPHALASLRATKRVARRPRRTAKSTAAAWTAASPPRIRYAAPVPTPSETPPPATGPANVQAGDAIVKLAAGPERLAVAEASALAAADRVAELRVVVLPESHRLAGRSELRPEDLRDEVFIEQPASVPQAWRDHWLLVAENGERPRTSPHTADKHEDWLHLIAQGKRIDTAPAVLARYYVWPEVAYVPLVDAEPCTLAIVRRRDVADPVVDELITLARQIVAHAAYSGTPYSDVARS